MTPTNAQNGYAAVNGLKMYYEIHGSGGTPLVLLHGAFSAIGSSFGALWPELAKTRQVVAFEYQGHGRTADIDRPMTIEQLADDVAAAITQLAIAPADLLGYSLGAGIALHVALRYPAVVRKLVLASVTTKMSGIHPGLMDGMGAMQPSMMCGSPWHEEYVRLAPDPQGFDTRSLITQYSKGHNTGHIPEGEGRMTLALWLSHLAPPSRLERLTRGLVTSCEPWSIVSLRSVAHIHDEVGQVHGSRAR